VRGVWSGALTRDQSVLCHVAEVVDRLRVPLEHANARHAAATPLHRIEQSHHARLHTRDEDAAARREVKAEDAVVGSLLVRVSPHKGASLVDAGQG